MMESRRDATGVSLTTDASLSEEGRGLSVATLSTVCIVHAQQSAA